VHRVLASTACRTAYMFGDTLSQDNAQQLLLELGATHQWTECAHGRPTVAPLVDLAALSPILAGRRGSLTAVHSPERGVGLGGLRARLGKLLE